MRIAALTTWVLAALLGLYMFTVWLIEDDGSQDLKGYRRLRAPVVFSHAALAVAGLVIYLVFGYVDWHSLVWAAVGILAVVAALGVFMFTRWIPVHRMASAQPDLLTTERERAASHGLSRSLPEAGPERDQPLLMLPPERHFPVPVVLLHGVFAVTTFVLVLLVALLK
jgi:hypothetical protein